MSDSNPRALIVEDDVDLHPLLESVLGDTVDVTFAPDLASARDALRSESFALMVLDIQLPDGTGVDLLKEVRDSDELSRARQLPVIVLTTSQSAEHYEDTHWLGTVAYVQKPLDIPLLRRAVAQALAS